MENLWICTCIYNLSILKYELNYCLNSYIANYKDVNKIQKIKNIYNSRKEIRKIEYNFIKKSRKLLVNNLCP